MEEGDEDKRRGCRREIGTMNESSKTKENEEEDIEEKENQWLSPKNVNRVTFLKNYLIELFLLII